MTENHLNPMWYTVTGFKSLDASNWAENPHQHLRRFFGVSIASPFLDSCMSGGALRISAASR